MEENFLNSSDSEVANNEKYLLYFFESFYNGSKLLNFISNLKQKNRNYQEEELHEK